VRKLKNKDNKVGNLLFVYSKVSLCQWDVWWGCMQHSESFIKADKSSDLIPWPAMTDDTAFFTLD
jgi:hypothetical protein